MWTENTNSALDRWKIMGFLLLASAVDILYRPGKMLFISLGILADYSITTYTDIYFRKGKLQSTINLIVNHLCSEEIF